MGDDLFRQLLVDPFAQHRFLFHGLAGSVGILDFEALDIDLAFDQAQLEDLEHLLQLELGFCRQLHGQVLLLEAAFAAQVVTSIQFLDRVVDRVGDFVLVQFGHHVERGHGIPPLCCATGRMSRARVS